MTFFSIYPQNLALTSPTTVGIVRPRAKATAFIINIINLIFLAALGPGAYSACNTNESQKQKKNVSGK
jgi:hypothetical protein